MSPPESNPASLRVFFEEMSRFLRAELTVEELEARIGPTTSPEGRLLFYQELVGGNWARILNSIYPGVRAVMDANGPRAWARTVRLYRDHRRANHWDLNQYGAAFGAHLAERRAAGESLAEVLDELADYEWQFHLISRTTERFEPEVHAINPTAVLRHYTHEIPRFVAAVRREEEPDLGERPFTVFLYRAPRDLSVRYLEGNLPRLLCYAALHGEAGPDTVTEAGASEELLLGAADYMIRAGVLGGPAREGIKALFQ